MFADYLFKVTGKSLLSAFLVTTLVGVSFFMLEPQVGRSQDTSGPFTISQTIVGEISFSTEAANVTMVGSLNGLTGGTATGTTFAVVKTNSNTGYAMTIHFATNTSPLQTMQGIVTGSSSIIDHPASSSQPHYMFISATSAALFGYTVSASSSSDLDRSFLNNGSNSCDVTGGSYLADRCWMEPATTTFQIINRTTSAADGATTTVTFRVYVPNNPSPGLVADTYVATATLTATNQ